MTAGNPIVSDRDVAFVLYELLEIERRLVPLPAFEGHSKETFDLFIASCRRLARDVVFPAYRALDEQPPKLADGKITVHPRMHEIFRALRELGVITATRPADVGGQALPTTVSVAAAGYLMGASPGTVSYPWLTTGAAHLIEAFGDDDVKARFMTKMYAGEWTGTMALTEPQAGSSLADVKTTAVPMPDGSYRVRGSKIFISGGDHDMTENVVHLALARIEGAPAGIKGVSLFAVPKMRDEGGKLVDNDVVVAGMIHKIGWRALPSLALNYGERGDCHGWLVGGAHQGIPQMFQMMNEARIGVGMHAFATASVAYHEALAYARARTQGRLPTNKDPSSPQVPIAMHADVKRMLLRQKAIVEGSLALVLTTALYADLAAHGSSDAERARAKLLVDLLTPVTKSFPAEKGFEANALAVQVHGGYGYSSEFLVEAFLRDQKLNAIHEGTTGIHSLDLLGRKVMFGQGTALMALADETRAASSAAREVVGLGAEADALDKAIALVGETTMALGALGAAGDVPRMLAHSVDFLDLFGTVVVAWCHLRMAAVAAAAMATDRGASGAERDFYDGKVAACRYWFATEVPRAAQLAALCTSGDDSFTSMRDASF